MDKYEYKLRADEIKALIAKGEYAEAASIADTIDWRRVKSVMMLCTISDLYKINRRFDDARDVLLLAYDRHPGGRSIVYSLCELSIKMGEFVQAVEYYKEFVQVAPKDSGRYVLQYKLYEAQEVSLEERIAVLEELKSKDYTEKWAYELAYLYHRIGLATRCVEECDELILWFGEGKYVLKAMELKMLHESLTETQQEKYNLMKGISRPVAAPVQEEVVEVAQQQFAPEVSVEEPDIQVKLMNVGQYDTINMQKELAQNMKELWEGPAAVEEVAQEPTAEEELARTRVFGEVSYSEENQGADADTIDPVTKAILAPMLNSDTGMIDLPDEETADELVEERETKVEEVFFGETGEIGDIGEVSETREIDTTAALIMEEMKQEAMGEKPVTFMEEEETEEADELPMEEPVAEPLVNEISGGMKEWYVGDKPTGFEKILGMEYDGQISMIMPESEQVEKQITGQIRLEDVLLEWEKMKKDSEQKRMEAVRQRVLEQTGAMFTEFEAATRDGLLEKLENGSIDMEDVDDAVADMVDVEEELSDEELAEEVSDEMTEDVMAEEEELVSEEEVPVDESIEAETEELVEIEETSDEEAEEVFAEEEVAEEVFEEEPAEEEPAAAGDEETVEEESVEEAVTEELVEEEPAAEDEDTVEETVTEESEAEEPVEEEAVAEESVEEEPMAEEPAAVEPEEEEPVEEEPAIEEPTEKDTKDKKAEKSKVRPMSAEEQKLFASYTHSKTTKEQIVHAIDSMSLAAYTGNVLITGEEGMDTLSLAKSLIKEIQQTDSNFSGKIAKISGASLNRKGIEQPMERLVNGALIVQKAGDLKKKTVEELHKALQQENTGMIVILEDTKKAINKLVKENENLSQSFNIRIDIEALDNDTLVAYGKQYALEQEYSIDEMGVLALHTCIADRQTSDHFVTIFEVKGIVDDAIHNANRKSIGHFFDVLLAKRYDAEDMIILREKDFI